MERAGSTEAAAAILDDFARGTGLEGDARPRRYLWTDALAVCTWLTLHGRTGDPLHLERARALVDQVHAVLGRHRADGPCTGWLSGLSDAEGALHPTRGGLRIGKPLPERGPSDRFDSDLEWDRDGQYFHYLTRWMHALHRVAIITGESRYHLWAAELARAAQEGFAIGPPGRRRLVWKMSVDLGRVLVPSSGHHDPLDGLVTVLALRASPVRDPAGPDLAAEVAELDAMCADRSWATEDALGIGGLLTDALRVAQLVAAGAADRADLLEQLCDDAGTSLVMLVRRHPLALPPGGRLPFRELGLAIGLRAVERLAELAGRRVVPPSLRPTIERLRREAPLAALIEDAWLAPGARLLPTWTEHADINAVTLAASLAPEGLLGA